MFVRAYVETPVPLETLSFEAKRKRLLLERKGIDAVEIRGAERLVRLISEDNTELFDFKNCLLELRKDDPKDGLSDGLKLEY